MTRLRQRGLVARSGQVAVGVVTAGLGTMIMLATVSRLTTPEVFSVFAAWWIAATLVIFPLGVFEVLLARLVISDVAIERSAAPSVGAVAARAGTWVVLLAGVLISTDRAASAWLFDGFRGLPALLGCFLLVGLCQTLQRGLMTGQGSFGTVGIQLASDGVFRALFATLAAFFLPTRPEALVGAVCLGSAASVILVHRKAPGWVALPRLRDARISSRLSLLLLVGSAGPILINNAAVPWLSVNAAGAVIIGAFSGALTLSRVPIQFSSAFFGPLLNRMSHAIEVGDRRGSRTLNRHAVTVAALTAALFALGFATLGGTALRLLVGGTYTLPWWTFGCLGLSSGLMLVSVVVQARAAAEQRWAGIAGCWIAGAVSFLLCLVGPGNLLQRASLAPLTGSAVALVGLVAITLLGIGPHRPQAGNRPSADR